MRKLVNGFGVAAEKCCPLPALAKALAESYTKQDMKLKARLSGFSFLYTMIWVGAQMTIYVCLFILFLLSEKNPYMKDEDCCTADTYLERNGNDLPYADCPTQSCQLYDFEFDGTGKQLGDYRPRDPEDGEYSSIFANQGTQWCCNLHATDTECCSKLGWGWTCGCIMWMCGFASICSMVMSQVILQGFYSFTARRNPINVALSTFAGIFMRLFLFQIMYHLFGVFCFLFLHFWYPMIQCDNPHALKWWEFGYEYFYHFFASIGWVATHGFTEWDGYMDLDTFISTHATMAFVTDLAFAIIYAPLYKIKDQQHRPYLHLSFFKLWCHQDTISHKLFIERIEYQYHYVFNCKMVWEQTSVEECISWMLTMMSD